MTYLETVSDANNLFDAFQLAKKGSCWKASTQRCQANLLKTIYELQTSLRNGTYTQKPFFEFVQRERGKIRPIRSQHINDRIVQRSLCDNVLIPKLLPYLIYDNGASLKGKGVDFARRRIKTHLEKFLRHHSDGYVLQIDFAKFFDNIRHDKLLEMYRQKLSPDNSIMPLLYHITDAFKADVSYMGDHEFVHCLHSIFDSMVHRQRIKADGQRRDIQYLRKSLGIGAQFSQISGVSFPCPLDLLCTTVMGFKYYGRYMDDVYVIHEDKSKLRQLLKVFMECASSLGMFINTTKTQIVKLSHGFTYLKTRYTVVAGRVVYKAVNTAFVRMRRKLKRYRGLFDRGVLTRKMVSDAYQSWRGNAKHYNRKQNLRHTDNLYNQLFFYN